MAMSCLDTDLTSIFAASDFGEAVGSVTWRGVAINGCIFDDEDVQVELGEGVGEIVHQSSITAPASSFPGIADGDLMTVRGDAFTVKFWKDDGTGVIEIFMERV